MRIDAALDWAVNALAGGDSPSIDAKILLAHTLNTSLTYLFTWPEKIVPDASLAQFKALIAQRKEGLPVAYLTGQKDFWTLTLNTSPHTLIPRPDTEVLVEQVLNIIASEYTSQTLSICDLGTGTGAIALALAAELPQHSVRGVDFLDEAVFLATENAKTNNITNVRFTKSDWFEGLVNEKFNVIVSNPPYIEASSPYLHEGDVKFEPKTALTSGPDGLDDIRKIIALAPGFLYSGGLLAFEHGFNQAEAVHALFIERGFVRVRSQKDFGGNDRVTLGFWETCD
ncbi:peptide chain release factor N(5)-glutamine methyltransferase [Alteromonas sp.]|nr:peptide chain release factor N(5)-glutamine methyltransferase [Alteromonas sp.]